MVQSVIVDRRFCVPGPVDLVMVRDKIASQYGNFVIGDVNGNMMFQVKKPGFGLHKKMILLDSSGSPVLPMKEKVHRLIKKTHTHTHNLRVRMFVTMYIVGFN